MSGGHFDYNQNHIKYFIEELENVINNNDNEELNEYGDYKVPSHLQRKK